MNKLSRMEQLGNLLTAMIAVIVGGSSDLLVEPPRLRLGVDAQFFLYGGKYYGVLARTSVRLGLPRTQMSIAIRCPNRWPEVTEAIKSEMREVDALPEQELIEVLTEEERSGFKRKGKYYGIMPDL